MTEVYELLREAIINKDQVVCEYQGYQREICPHVIGTKEGKRQMLAYQFGGHSSRGLPPGGAWRCMVVDEITNAVSIPSDEWHTGDRHTKRQTCVDYVDEEVDY